MQLNYLLATNTSAGASAPGLPRIGMRPKLLTLLVLSAVCASLVSAPAMAAQTATGGGSRGGSTSTAAVGGDGNGFGGNGNDFSNGGVAPSGGAPSGGNGQAGTYANGVNGSGGTVGTTSASDISGGGPAINGGAGGNGTSSVTNGTGGGGGGAGAFLTDIGTINSNVAIQGGNGGATPSGARPGGGGGGGAGLMLNSLNSASTLTVDAAITAGNGGSAGAVTTQGGSGGGGGGTGVLLDTSSSSGLSGTIITLINNSTIQGGNGGNGSAGGGGSPDGGAGYGGAGVGVRGAGVMVRNGTNGTIRGGTGGNSTRPSAGYDGNGGAGIWLNGSNATIVNDGHIFGGNSGNASGGVNATGGAGIDNAGGITGAMITNTATGTITGGAARDANGTSGAGIAVNRGTIVNSGAISGGTATGPNSAGGVGVSAFNGSTITNIGTNAKITGGNGIGSGAGGIGIIGANLRVTSSGAISGGQAGNGSRANAISFTGGTNTLELQAGFSNTGNVLAFSANDTLSLGGATDASFNVSTIGAAAQYRNFGIYEKNGDSTWTLTGTTGAVTPWRINQGILSISQDGNLGSTGGGITLNGGTLQATADISDSNRAITITSQNGGIDVTSANTLTWNGVISGSGALTKTGTGKLVLTGTETYSGGTTISAGTLQLGNGGTSGAIVGDVANNGTLAFDRSDVYTFGGVISGSGAVSQIGSGTTVLTADNTYSGGTTISAGVLQLGDGGTSGSIVGDVANDGTLAFNRSDAYLFSGVISGSGAVNQIGSGTTVLTGDSTYTGGTTISAGTLQLGNGGASGSIVGDVANDGTLAFARSDTYTFGGVISGSGAVNQIGSGTTVLTGANTYSGATTVSAGTLQAGATDTFSPNSAVSVEPAGTLNLAGFNQTVLSLSNAGLVRLNAAGATPGTVLNATSYISRGGTLALNTVLNEGGANSHSDQLVVNNTQLDTGPTTIQVTNVGGPGAQTVGNGIELVRVEDPAQSPAGVFRLNNRLVAGAYEYDLYHGSADGSPDGNWYLRSLSLPPDNGNGGNGGNGGGSKPTPRPETGVYLRNLTAASGMFMHTLHDRLGEPQFTDRYQTATSGKVSSVWLRVAGNRTDGKAGNGEIDLNTDTSLVHFGGDLARWSNNGKDRWLFGVMGAYGESNTDAEPEHNRVTNSGIRRSASGKVDGYGAGAYLTWYGNKDKPAGPYVDLWGMYNWYHNQVNGNGLPEESYHSRGWTVSAETGYAFMVKDGGQRQWMIEPQAQVAYSDYNEDDHRERNGTLVSEGRYNNTTTRLGVRAYTRSKLGDNGVQPFVELNWWHGSAQSTLQFNGTLVSDGTPDNIYELKAGIEGEIARRWQMWGHLGWRQGGSDYTAYEGMVGVKHLF